MAFTSWAHNYHAVRTKVQLNEQTGSVEIIHRAFVNDFNTVISLELNEYHELAETSWDERWVMGYWNRYFGLLTADDKPVALEWVGMEIDDHYLWVYQEYKGKLLNLQNTKLHNGLLFGQFEHQINTVDVKLGKEKAALVFTNRKTLQFLLKPSNVEAHSHQGH